MEALLAELKAIRLGPIGTEKKTITASIRMHTGIDKLVFWKSLPGWSSSRQHRWRKVEPGKGTQRYDLK